MRERPKKTRFTEVLALLAGTAAAALGVACGPILPFVIPAESPIDDSQTTARESVSFVADWKTDSSKGGWTFANVARGSSIVADVPTWHGPTSARVEVRPGDDPLGRPGERAEVAVMPARGKKSYENASSATVYYALSYKIPSGWKNPASSTSGWSHVFQLRGPDDLGLSPAFTLNVKDRFSATLHAGDIPVDSNPRSYYELAFTDGSLNLDKWTDFVIAIGFSPTMTGKVEIWRRNEGQSQFTRVAYASGIPTLQYNSGVSTLVGDHYWKQGLDRSDSAFTSVLWMGPVARGASFHAVERAAFGTNAGPPK